MKITKSTIVLLVFVLMLSILVANVADLINVDTHVLDDTLSNKYTREEWSRPRYYDIGTTFDHLIWFLQISDIHISIFRDPFRITELKEFCNVTVDIIKPSVVLASGDLTDAKAKDKMGSKQILEEWKYYKQVLDETEVAKKTLWLDVRGNHDNFNVVSLEAKNNYYSNYSIQGKKHPRSYMYTINIGSELYTFIAVDACLKPGPRRPFNFVGVLDEQEIKSIHSLVNKSQESNADFVIWFGHYPTSCILSQTNTGVRNIIGRYKESMVYLCGHYHTLGGTVPNMYTLQQAGFLELELADWKDNRMYRLAAIDHGQFSFIDVKHEEWPVVLITNPKHALYTMPRKENVLSVVKSTHIRVLAFSIAPIKSVEVQLDDATWFKCPWAIGEVIDNHTGVIFAWGTFVGNSYLPGAFTYAYGFFQLFSFHLPLMLILAHRVDKRLQSFNKPGHKSVSKVCILWQHLPITLLVIMQVSMAYFFWLAYGTLATVLCPLRTWSILLAIMLWHQVNTMPQSCLRSATAIWSPHG
ncbi:Transmembrane protein 62 [Dufourea novaeangliae]|uniref:Transmembrane protein 62 n=1 Tax=Dufourea novaeangliae TaxID=178035 RepID=A0A154PQJ2_DUFNO|nr:Transmembrane protein 62 [Dufourea novaeangliae]